MANDENMGENGISEFQNRTYLTALKRIHRQTMCRNVLSTEMMPPRERYRKKGQKEEIFALDNVIGSLSDVREAKRIAVMASLVPDEIIYKHSDHCVRPYETALMFIDVSGFTELCEIYKKAGHGGPSRLTQVLNLYIGAMVQEILTHKGDVLKFSGDAFLCMWKKSLKMNMQDVVHTAIDCGLLIQRNYGRYITDVGVILKVKIAIAAGLSQFSIVGGHDSCQSHYVVVGQPVWDIKMAEYMSTAGDVITSASVWMYVNESDYCTQPCGDGRHTKVLGVGATWKRVQRINSSMSIHNDPEILKSYSDSTQIEGSPTGINYREFSLRPAVITAMRSTWWPALRRYMPPPILRAVDNDEPMDFLTEIRHVVVVFLNIITRTVTEDVLIQVVNNAFKIVCCVTSKTGGLVNKVSMFDKDMMFLMVFGLRGLKHEDEAQNALLCANQLKEHLNDVNITTVSVGVTSGSTYCGVVGHALRREYTVIGSAVNKAARLMIAYPNKVTCDKETFLRSKLDHDFFKLMEVKILKGFSNPGHIYEFNRSSSQRASYSHPILGRDEELQVYLSTLQKAMDEYPKKFTRYRDHKFAVAIVGSRLAGKSRLMSECLNITPKCIEIDQIVLTEKDKVPYQLLRHMMSRLFKGIGRSRENREGRIRFTVDMTSLSPLEIYAINTIFDCRFPLPESFEYDDSDGLLKEYQVRVLMQNIFEASFKNFRVVAIAEAQHIDDESWKMLTLILQYKIFFILFTVTDEEKLSLIGRSALSNHMIVKMHIAGINRRFLSALACQLLDVQAIPSELDKVIESASEGLPGWIQNFLICLVQREQLTMVTVPRAQALDTGALIPPTAMLKTAHDSSTMKSENFNKQYERGETSLTKEHKSDIIHMAVLSKHYKFEDVKMDMKMDVLILKTYDSLTPFEKMLLKCGSVLGEVFSRRMLLHSLRCESPRKVSEAVAKLFSIRVLECEGGDFTRDHSKVLIHPAPVRRDSALPFCFCLGTIRLNDCDDLPDFAFCGYMKFRHALFRSTTYDLLTDCQKTEMHARALLYLERYTRKCSSCGFGLFSRLFGLKSDDGLKKETEELKQTREQIRTLNAESKVSENNIYSAIIGNINEFGLNRHRLSRTLTESEADLRRFSRSIQIIKDTKIPSFSSIDLDTCECIPILLVAYSQAICHCHWAGSSEKLFDAYIEYADLSILNGNVPQAIHLLYEVEQIVKREGCFQDKYIKWMFDSKLARIYSLRGACLLECGDLKKSREYLCDAMKLFHDPFPETTNATRIQNFFCSFNQLMLLYVMPRFYVGIESGVVADFFESIAWNLNILFKLFMELKEENNAALAAKWSLNYALKSDSNFRLLCTSYGNLLSVYRQKQKFRLCRSLENKARELCNRKRGHIDIMEAHAVGHLYTNIFLYHVQRGNKLESLEFGLSVMRIMTDQSNVTTRESLIFWILKLLLTELRIQQMVSIMKECMYDEHYDVSSEIWYYFYAMSIFLDTGYCVEPYRVCETFYIQKGDLFLRSKTPEAGWNFYACMWLFTIRVGMWEKSILWNDKIEEIQEMDCIKHEYYTSMLLLVVEGYMIDLVRELNNKNIKKIVYIAKYLKTLIPKLDDACNHFPIFRSRYYLLNGYFNYIQHKRQRGFNFLNKALQIAKQYSDTLMIIWIEHNRLHWKKTLHPRLENYWSEHVDSDTVLNYKTFEVEKGKKIIPYTLPLPKIFNLF